MRYVNLKKKHKTKFHYISKNLAAFSFIGLVLTAVVVLPITDRTQQVKAVNEPEVVEIDNDYINDNDVAAEM